MPRPKPTGGVFAPPVKPVPFLPAVDLPVDPLTPFRALGDMSIETWLAEFARAHSPWSERTLEPLWRQARGATALICHLGRWESRLGANLPYVNNWLGLRFPDSPAFMSFASPETCLGELLRRWSDPTYKGGVYMPQTLSARDFYDRYSPPSENPTVKRLSSLLSDVNQWRSEDSPTDPWRPYPWPAMVELIVTKPYEGAGFDRVAFRGDRIEGKCDHITDGEGSIESYQAFFSTGGERAADALVDTVIGRDGRIGLLNDWRNPNRGGTRAGWANGGTDGLEGIGVPFYRRFPRINDVLVSTEHVTRSGVPLNDAQLSATIELSTAIMQNHVRVPADSFPLKDGLDREQYHAAFAIKACPDEPFLSTHRPVIIREAKKKLAAWQGHLPPPPPPPPEWVGPWGLPIEFFARQFGVMKIPDSTLAGRTAYPFDPKGSVSLAWLERVGREGILPEVEELVEFDSDLFPGKERWVSFVNGWRLICPIDNQRAGWRWLDELVKGSSHE